MYLVKPESDFGPEIAQSEIEAEPRMGLISLETHLDLTPQLETFFAAPSLCWTTGKHLGKEREAF